MKKLKILIALIFVTSAIVEAQIVPPVSTYRIPGVSATLQTLLNETQPYALYVTNVTQSSTSAPVDTATQNVGRLTITWTRYSAGYYAAYCSGCFDKYGDDATQIYFSNPVDTAFISIKVQTVDSLNVRTYNATKVLSDGLLNHTPMQIWRQP